MSHYFNMPNHAHFLCIFLLYYNGIAYNRAYLVYIYEKNMEYIVCVRACIDLLALPVGNVEATPLVCCLFNSCLLLSEEIV